MSNVRKISILVKIFENVEKYQFYKKKIGKISILVKIT